MTKIVLFFKYPNFFNFFLKLFCGLIKLIIFVKIITMKTAMQELIDDLKTKDGIIILDKVFMQKYLEKEKEQIIDAYDNGMYGGTYAVDKDGNEYYNQTYNQKQYIIDIMKADEDDGLYNQNK
jgi:hypothetical protein